MRVSPIRIFRTNCPIGQQFTPLQSCGAIINRPHPLFVTHADEFFIGDAVLKYLLDLSVESTHDLFEVCMPLAGLGHECEQGGASPSRTHDAFLYCDSRFDQTTPAA